MQPWNSLIISAKANLEGFAREDITQDVTKAHQAH
jgi:hypothetical protein